MLRFWAYFALALYDRDAKIGAWTYELLDLESGPNWLIKDFLLDFIRLKLFDLREITLVVARVSRGTFFARFFSIMFRI